MIAVFSVTSGRPVRMKCRNGSLSFSASAVNSAGISTSMPASRSLAKPCPATSGLGSLTGATTRATPAWISASTHGRRAALVRAGLQIQIEGGAARLVAGLRQGDDFGVVQPGVGVKAAAHHFAIAHQDRSHQRIGTGQRPAFARQVERFAHVLRGHFSKSDSMNFSESKGSRSSIFSPTPI